MILTKTRINNVFEFQENLHYVLDICDTTGLYILDDDEEEIMQMAIGENDGIINPREHKYSREKSGNGKFTRISLMNVYLTRYNFY